MKIGELAKRSECSIQAIRHYEKEGLLHSSSRSEGNFRLYDDAAVERLMFIRRCRSLDLSLPEVKHLLSLSQAPTGTCREVNEMVDEHIKQVEDRIAELQSLQRQLQDLRSNCSENRTVGDCGIIRNLVEQ